MPRKGHTLKRDVLADPIYNSKVVTKLINSIMLDGKKGIAQKIVYGAFEQVNAETGKDAIEVFESAMNNVMPSLEVKAKRIGGATYQVPLEVKAERREALGLRWITQSSRNRGEKTQKHPVRFDADFGHSHLQCPLRRSQQAAGFDQDRAQYRQQDPGCHASAYLSSFP